MQKILFVILIFIGQLGFSQSTTMQKKVERHGVVFGLGVGAGVLKLNTNDTIKEGFSTTLPNFKLGYMVRPQLEVFALLPGANYKYNGKDRGFEGFILGTQYWMLDRWWVLGGVGLTFDAPAFYTVKNPKTAEFNTGLPAFSLGTGFEVWKNEQYAVDIQYRFFMGTSNLPNDGTRKGMSNMLIVGFNVY